MHIFEGRGTWTSFGGDCGCGCDCTFGPDSRLLRLPPTPQHTNSSQLYNISTNQSLQSSHASAIAATATAATAATGVTSAAIFDDVNVTVVVTTVGLNIYFIHHKH